MPPAQLPAQSGVVVNPINKLINYMEQFLPPANSPEETFQPSPQKQEAMREVIQSRKRKWDTMQEQSKLFDSQLVLCKNLVNTTNILSTKYNDLVSTRAEINALHTQLAETQGRSASELKELDRRLTLAECMYSEIYQNHKEANETRKQLHQKYTDNMEMLQALQGKYESDTEMVRAKRARLGSLTAEEAEYFVFKTLVDERKRGQAQLAEQARLYEPYHCGVCSEALATQVLPCCHHLLCLGCVARIHSDQDTFPCPYCRRALQPQEMIEMKF
jgi:hypothetical protein